MSYTFPILSGFLQEWSSFLKKLYLLGIWKWLFSSPLFSNPMKCNKLSHKRIGVSIDVGKFELISNLYNMDTMIALIVISWSFVPFFFPPLVIQLTGKMTSPFEDNNLPQVTFQPTQKGPLLLWQSYKRGKCFNLSIYNLTKDIWPYILKTSF